MALTDTCLNDDDDASLTRSSFHMLARWSPSLIAYLYETLLLCSRVSAKTLLKDPNVIQPASPYHSQQTWIFGFLRFISFASGLIGSHQNVFCNILREIFIFVSDIIFNHFLVPLNKKYKRDRDWDKYKYFTRYDEYIGMISL